MLLDNFLQNRKIVYGLLLIGLINAVLIAAFYSGHFYRGDTPEYIETARWLAGDKTAEVFPERVLKPLSLTLPMLFEKFGWLGEHGLQFQNIIFYFLSIVLLFDLVLALTLNRKQAVFAVVLFITAWPFLNNALSYLTDMAGWFFYLLAVWLIIKLHQANKMLLIRHAAMLGFVTGIGFLFKESAVAAGFFYFGYLLFVNKEIISKRIASLIVFGLAFFLPVIISSIWAYRLSGYTFLDWYVKTWSNPFYYTALNVFLNIGITFLLAWFFVLWGVIAEWKEKNRERLRWFLAFLLPSLCSFIWSFPGARILYIAFPLLVLLASRGLIFIERRRGRTLAVILLVICVAFNFIAPKIASFSQLRAFFGAG